MTEPDPQIVKQAIAELRDVNKERRRTAVMKLGMLGGEDALRSLIMVVRNPNEDGIVRGRAAIMLGNLGDVRAVDPLIEALDAYGYQTRLHATEALGKLGGARAIRALVRVLDEDHDRVGVAAQTALQRLGYFKDADATAPSRENGAASTGTNEQNTSSDPTPMASVPPPLTPGAAMSMPQMVKESAAV